MSVIVLASCTTDVDLYVEKLPERAQDSKVLKRVTRLGGCGYHVAKSCNDAVLACPLGVGIYADFIKDTIFDEEMDILFFPVKEENGMCLCLIEPDGQRTFIASHGAEYHFSLDMVEQLPEAEYVYLSGIDLEEESNSFIIEEVRNKNWIPFFSPGPRIAKIRNVADQILELKPYLHMNKEELLEWTNLSLEEGMRSLYEKTKRLVIVTDGKKGSYAYEGALYFEPSDPIVSKNVTGAGDTHAGSCLDSLTKGVCVQEMLKIANEKAKEKIRDTK